MSKNVTESILSAVRASRTTKIVESETVESLDIEIDSFLKEGQTPEGAKVLLDKIDIAISGKTYKGTKNLNDAWNSVAEYADKKDLGEAEEIQTTPDDVVTVPLAQDDERDYTLIDVTEMNPTADGDVRAPEDMTACLLSANSEMDESFGSSWGTINILSTRKPKDAKTESALVEFIIGKKSYLASFILNDCEDGRKEFQVKDTMSNLVYSKKTNNPQRVIENYIRSLYDESVINESEDNSLLTRVRRIISKNNYDATATLNIGGVQVRDASGKSRIGFVPKQTDADIEEKLASIFGK